MKSPIYQHELSAPDYRHESHAGNIGDVWKHCVLLAIIAELIKNPQPLTVIDTHAGDGLFNLKPVGEWNGAVEKLLMLDNQDLENALRLYLNLVSPYLSASERNKRYPGSPLLITKMLREHDKLIASEIAPEVFKNLGAALSHDKRANLNLRDGLATLCKDMSSSPKQGQLLVHVDPPWNSKQDWQNIPKAVIEAAKSNRSASLALWYPIKSYTRVNQMRREFSIARLKAVAVELITTPLEIKRNRLNGSGMILINVSDAILHDLATSAVTMGRACASHDGYFQSSVTSL